MGTSPRKAARPPGVGQRRHVVPVVLAAMMVGVVLGVVNSLSNSVGSPYGSLALRPLEGIFALEVLAAVIGTAWAWALVAFGVGWYASSKWCAVLLPVLALEIAVLVYYVSDFVSKANDELSTGEIEFWGLVSLAVGPAFGLAGFLARRPRRWSIVPGLAAPGVVAFFNACLVQGSDEIRPWPNVVGWVIVGALLIALALRWLKGLREAERQTFPPDLERSCGTDR